LRVRYVACSASVAAIDARVSGAKVSTYEEGSNIISCVTFVEKVVVGLSMKSIDEKSNILYLLLKKSFRFCQKEDLAKVN
jgi:hypothetical protein